MTTGRRLALAALFLVAPVLFFHRVCLAGEIFLLRDLFDWFYPWRVFAAESFARGEFPLWNPWSYLGTPFLANMQSGLLYPPNVVFWLLDFPAAMRLFLVIQSALAAGFTYLLLRAMSCRVSSSLTGALAYAYGGWMVAHVEFPNKLATAAWLPLILLGVVTWRKGRPLAGWILGALACACCVTAGYPSLTLVLALGAAAYWAALLLLSAAERPGFAALAREALSLPAILALGALLAAAQILPFLEAASLSSYPPRFHPLGLHPLHFLDLLYPRVFGLPGYDRYWGGNLHQFWLGHFYVGLATLALALTAAASLSRRDLGGRRGPDAVAAAAGLAGLGAGLALSLGDHLPLVPPAAWSAIGLSRIKWISTSSVLVAFSLSWLAAFGQERILRSLEGGGPVPRRARIAAACGCGAVVLLGLAAMAAPAAFEGALRAVVSPLVLPEQGPALAAHAGLVRADAVRAGVMAALLGGAWWASWRGRLPAAMLGASIPLVLFVDLAAASAGINFSTSPEIYRETAPRARELAERLGDGGRIYVTSGTLSQDRVLYGSRRVEDFRWAADTLLFNLNLPHGLLSASDGDPLRSARWARFSEGLEEGDDDLRGRLLSLAGVAVILDGAPGRPAREIEIPTRLPRVWVAAGARRVPAGQALAAMREEEWNPWIEVIVEGPFPGDPRPAGGRPVEHRIHATRFRLNSVEIDVESAVAGYLVLADADYPGWRASVDGDPAAVFTADAILRGVDLPAGRHMVRFEYRPASVAWGAAGSAAGALLTGLLGRLASRRSGPSRRRSPAAGTDPG